LALFTITILFAIIIGVILTRDHKKKIRGQLIKSLSR